MMKDLEKRIEKLEKLRLRDKEAFLLFAKSYTTDVEEEDDPVCEDKAEEVFANHRGAKSVADDAETQGAKNVAATDAETHATLSLSLSDLAVSETGLQEAKSVADDAETQRAETRSFHFQGAKNVAATDAETHATLSLSLSDLAVSETGLQEAKSVAANAETQRAETTSFNFQVAKNVAGDAETHATLSLSLSDLAVSETGLQGAKIVAAHAETAPPLTVVVKVESSETPTPPVLVHLDDDFQGAKNAETHATLSLSHLADSETRLQEAKNVAAADAETQETVKESAASGSLVKEAVKVIEAGKAPPPVRVLPTTFEGNGPVQGKTVAPPPARPSFASSVQKTNLKEQESVEAVEGKSAQSSSTGRKKRKRRWSSDDSETSKKI